MCTFMWLVANMLCGVFAMDAVLTTSAPKGNQMFLTKAAPGKGIHGSGLWGSSLKSFQQSKQAQMMHVVITLWASLLWNFGIESSSSMLSCWLPTTFFFVSGLSLSPVAGLFCRLIVGLKQLAGKEYVGGCEMDMGSLVVQTAGGGL